MIPVWTSLLILAPLLAVLEIRAERSGATSQIYVLKPLTTFCILLIALLAPPPFKPGYHIPIVLGLLFSLLGDVFLMLRRDRFLAGLASFLVAHLFYILAFVRSAGFPHDIITLVILVAYGLYLLRRLWPHLGKYRVPVIIYAVVLLLMAAAAFHQFVRFPTPRYAAALAGAVLFVISDSLLALDRFETAAKRRQTLVLGTYFAAQWLIAVSVAQHWQP